MAKHATGDEIRAYAAAHGLPTTRARRAMILGLDEERRLFYGAQSARVVKNEWHIAPDGTDCCCTAEDRMYGCGCR